MLLDLTLPNFKSFGPSRTTRLAPLTLVFGSNSSGKSSLLQSLLLLRQSAPLGARQSAQSLVVRGEVIDLGSFESILHRHDWNAALSVGLTASSREAEPTTMAMTYRRGEAGVVSLIGFHLESEGIVLQAQAEVLRNIYPNQDILQSLEEPQDSLVVDAQETVALLRRLLSRVGTGDDLMSLVLEDAAEQGVRLTFTGRRFPAAFGGLVTRTGEAWVSIGSEVATDPDTSFVPRSRSTSPRMRDPLQKLVEEWVENRLKQLRTACLGMDYLGPMRQMPERISVLSSDARRDTGVRGEYVVELLARNRSLMRKTNDWFVRFDIPYSIDVRAVTDPTVAGAIGDVHCMLLKDRRSGVEVSPTDVGFGVSQVLPVIVQAIAGRPRSTLLIEQPEVHLHPALQAQLGDLFAEQIRGGDRQFIIETHSEHLVLRIKRLMRRGYLRPQDVSIVTVSLQPGGVSETREVRLGPDGEFRDEWPEGFFESRFDELFLD